ncbi:MAG: hypothetical protein QOD73_2416, partial [Solirubrobacteraceae bacterium]|nr:hypothetical protein [Solirubrobacteraceae bacterium]
AILVAILGTPSVRDPFAGFESGWAFMVIAAGLASGAALAIGRVEQRTAPATAAAPALS